MKTQRGLIVVMAAVSLALLVICGMSSAARTASTSVFTQDQAQAADESTVNNCRTYSNRVVDATNEVLDIERKQKIEITQDQLKAQQANLALWEESLKSARAGRITQEMKNEDRKVRAGELGIKWDDEWDRNYVSYYRAMISEQRRVVKEITDEIQQLKKNMTKEPELSGSELSSRLDELNKEIADYRALQEKLNCRDVLAAADREKEKANREEQEKLRNRGELSLRIEALKGKINALKKDHDLVTQNLQKASEQVGIATNAKDVADSKLGGLRSIKEHKGEIVSKFCQELNGMKPVVTASEIELLAAQAEAKQKESDRLLAEGNQLAANCGSPADAAAIRDRYNRIKSLPQQIDQLRKTADQKNALLDRARKVVEALKGREPARTWTEINDELNKAEEAAKQATQLMIQVRASVEDLDSAKTRLGREIDALHSAAPEALRANMQDQFNMLHGLLSSLTEHPFISKYDDEAGANAKLVRQFEEEALRILANWKIDIPCQTEIPSTDAATQRIDVALVMAAANDPADMLHQAQACEASAKCIPLINQSRQLFEQLRIEEGQAVMEQARQAGCNVAGLENALDYYRTIRDVAAVLNNAKENCRFKEGMDVVQKIPPSIQANPFIASAIAELRAGATAQQQIEQLISQATDAIVRAVDLARGPGDPIWSGAGPPRDCKEANRLAAQADGFLAQAYQLAGSYACLTARIDKYKAQYDPLKAQKQSCPPGTSNSTTEPTLEKLPEDTQPPTGEKPPEKKQPPELEPIPENKQPPTVEEIPEPKNEAPARNNPGDQAGGKKESKPKDPNKPSKWDKIGTILGGAVDAAVTEQERKKREGGSGGSGGRTGGGNTGGGSTGGSGGTGGGNAGGQDVDLSGTWERTGYAEDCTLTYTLSLRPAGNNTWTGPDNMRDKCANPGHNTRVPEGFQGNITLVVTGPGRLSGTYVNRNGERSEGSGTFTDSRIDLGQHIWLKR